MLLALSLSMTGMSDAGVRGIVLGVCGMHNYTYIAYIHFRILSILCITIITVHTAELVTIGMSHFF